jgi:chemotaxis protein MotB
VTKKIEEDDIVVIERCPPCERGPGMWMATFADMAILLMAMFVLLIALAETAKQRNTMFSIPGENQSAFGTQDIIESDLKPSGYQGANVSADTNEGYDQVVKALAKEINDGKVEVTIKDQRVVVNVEGSDNPNSDTARVQQEELEIYTKVAEVQRKIKVDVKVFQESEGTTSDSEAWEEMFSAQYRQIRGDLAQAIEQEKAEVIRDGDKIIVRLASQGSFKSGSAQLQPGFSLLLDDVGKAIQNVEGLITIEGHTDNLPVGFSLRFRSNWDLSAARSGAVADYMLTKYSFANGLMVSGLADTKPLMSNDTSEGRSRNRRIEVVIDGSF